MDQQAEAGASEQRESTLNSNGRCLKVIDRFRHADGLGSITAVTDANGAVVNRYAYDSFGRIQKSETVRNAYTFTGREYDSETGLYYLRARYYDPEAGRFVSKDPIGFAGGDVNLYGYVSQNPVNWVDPYGLYSFDEFLIDASNFSAGMGDTITGGGTKWIREQMNEAYGWGDDIVDSKCSKAYTAGVAAGYGWDVAFIAATGYKGVQPGGFLNSNRYLRVGFGRKGGNSVFRVAGQLLEKLTGKSHLDLWKGGPL